MATFHPAIRTNKEYNSVYVRISHNSNTEYIKTSMTVHKSSIRKGMISDHTILANCALKIKSYIDKINNTDITNWTVQELKKFLISDSVDISFSDFARKFINKMIISGRKKPAGNYTTALNSLESHYKKEISFSDITSKELRKWIESLSNTSRAKNMYPIIIKKLFDEGCLEYNDYDRNIFNISNQPFKAVKIPPAETPSKRSVDTEIIRKILDVKPVLPREELAHDVSKLVLYLVGINTIDLYFLEKKEFVNGKICYNRTKTEKERADKAYIEVKVPEVIFSTILSLGKSVLLVRVNCLYFVLLTCASH